MEPFFAGPAWDGQGNGVIISSENNYQSGNRKITASTTQNSGNTWSNIAYVRSPENPYAGNEVTPTVATDSSGNWVCIWSSDDPTGLSGGDMDLLVSRSTNGGTTWSQPQILNSNATIDIGDSENPTIAMNEAGHALAAWMSTNAAGDSGVTTTSESRVWTSFSLDGGQTWTVPQAPFSDLPGHSQTNPFLACNVTGFGIAFFDTNSTSATLKFSHKSTAASSWATPQEVAANVSYSNGPNRQVPSLAGNNSGSWMLAWDSRPMHAIPSIYVSVLQGLGTQWSSPHKVSEERIRPNITTDNAGTWCLASLTAMYSQESIHVSFNNGQNWVKTANFGYPPLGPNLPPAPLSMSPYMTSLGNGEFAAVYVRSARLSQSNTTLMPQQASARDWEIYF